MIDSVVFILSIAGFSTLMLSMPQHQRSWLGSTISPSVGRHMRRSGFLLLLLTLVVEIAASGWGEGLTVWFGWETLAGLLVVCANALHGRGKGGARK
ncbi:MAG: DUF3325 domain-containing protein [Sphingomonadales bacterium]|nr:DUF3325 domain-containing protein [Sphingomonadales bacterium]